MTAVEGPLAEGARMFVVAFAALVAAACFGLFVRATLFHVHSPSEHPHAHEWDFAVWIVLLGLGGLFAAIALSAARHWSWRSRLLAVVLGPPTAIVTGFVLAALSR